MDESFIETLARIALNIISYEALVALVAVGIVATLALQFARSGFNILTIGMTFVAIPALTPCLTLLAGYEYFTAMNYDLQRPRLITAAMLLLALFLAGMKVGSIAVGTRSQKVTRPALALSFDQYTVAAIFVLNAFLLFTFLEQGLILTDAYIDLKAAEAPFSSLVHQFFNLSMALFIASIPTMQRRRLIVLGLVVILVFALLVSRRNLAVGIIILLLYIYDLTKLNTRSMIMLAIAVLALLFIGEARNVGILNYLSGFQGDQTLLLYYSMPGGGANIFLALMGVIDLNASGRLIGAERMPMLLWASGRFEGQIYESHGYTYNGGMHLAAVFYWNFGLLGVFLGGIGLGALLNWCDKHLSRLRSGHTNGIGTGLGILTSLLLTSLIWYGPIGWINASIVLCLAFFACSFLPRKQSAVS